MFKCPLYWNSYRNVIARILLQESKFSTVPIRYVTSFDILPPSQPQFLW